MDGKECIKFSLMDENNITYYYIDIQKNCIYRKEEGTCYNNVFEVLFSTVYTYSESTVTDDDILKFDINNYPDYKITEE